MKNLFRKLLCVTGLAVMLSTGALAAESGDLMLISPAPAQPAPADSGISIEWNGEPLTFTDAAPQIVNDRTYLPFRTVFTALGFADEDITYQNETKTVCAQSEELTISMVIGENKVTVTKDGQTTVLETDVPAFIDPQVSRTYVPARFVAEAAEYRVGWNGDTRTVIIDDVDAILEGNQETYEVLDLYLDYSRKFQKKNYNVEGSYTANLLLGEDAMALGGTYSMLTSGGVKFDFETRMELAGMAGGQDLAAAIPEGVDLEMRGDMDAGLFYFKSNALMTMMEAGVENLWFRLDLAGMMDAMAAETGMGYADLMMSQKMMADMDGGAYIDYVVRMMADTDPTTSAVDSLALLNAILGDSAFTKEGGSYVSAVEMPGMSVSMVITTKSGKAVGYAMTCYAGDEAAGTGMVMEVIMEGEQLDMGMTMAADGMMIELLMDGAYTATDQKPAGQPGEEAAVMDLMELMAAQAPVEPEA